jgi:hypothetical protein
VYPGFNLERVLLRVGQGGAQLPRAQRGEMSEHASLVLSMRAVHAHDFPDIEPGAGDVGTNAARPLNEGNPWVPQDPKAEVNQLLDDVAPRSPAADRAVGDLGQDRLL